MTDIQDPFTQVNYLQQCLSSNKRPLGLFLGAGCPMAVKTDDEKCLPLIPDIAGITQKVREQLSKDQKCGPLLVTLENQFAKDGLVSASLEDMLSQVRGLRGIVGNDVVRGLRAIDLEALDSAICQSIQELADKELPNTRTPYHRLALWTDAAPREKPIEIFTTNYDLLLEQAFEEWRVPYFDGFAGSRKPSFDIQAMEEDKLPPRWARVWKLHGSINWYQDPKRGIFRSTSNEHGLKRVIHPSHLKYEESRRMPYLAMFDRLRAFLRQPSVALVTCGYSFRDDHINEVILQGLEGTQTAIAFAMLYGEIGKYPKAMKLAHERSNLSLLAEDRAIISTRDVKWPEREFDAISASTSGWVTWVPNNKEIKGSKQTAQFHLGDFCVFGDFLHELIGDIRRAMEVPNAK